MALVAWYKLDGNLNDSVGSLNGTGTDITSDSTGKIGSCYSFNGTSSRFYHNNTWAVSGSKNHFSLSFWMYPTVANGAKILAPNSAGYDHYIVYSASNYIVVHVCQSSDTGERDLTSTVTAPLNTWSHIAIIMDDLNIKIYINGAPAGEWTQVIPVAVWESLWYWGCRGTVYTGFYTGKLDDIKVYNHILSQKEVKALSQAKVLHYDFDDFQEPTTNAYPGPTTTGMYFIDAYDGDYGFGANTNSQWVIDNSYQPISEQNVQKISRINSGVSQRLYLQWSDFVNKVGATFAAGEERTISLYYYGTYGTSLYFYFGGNTGNFRLYPVGSSTGNTTITISVTENVWQRIAFRIKNIDATSSTFSWGWMRLHYNQEVATLDNTHFWKFSAVQSELKDHATPFVNGSRTGIVQDISGYGNNTSLTLATTPQWTSSKFKLGAGCYKFNGISQFILKSSMASYVPAACDYTQSLWFYVDSLPAGRVVLIDDNNQWEHWLALNSSGTLYAAYYNGSQYGTTSTNTVSAGQWYHVAVVAVSGVSIQIYVNGTLWASNTSIGGVHSKIYDDVVIGSNGGANAEKFPGYIDDVRLYATALPVSDILELYQTRVQLDKNGNLFANLLEEDEEHSKINISSTGKVVAAEFNETAITEGLVGWWPLDGSAEDISGNGSNGTVSGATVTPGLDSLCYSFNGSSNYIALNYGSGLTVNAMTITLWVKANSPSSSAMFLSSGQVPNNNARLYLSTYSSKWDMGIYDNGWGAGLVTATTDWTFISLVVNGTSASMYANLGLTRQINYLPYTLNQNIRLGTHGTDGSYYWNGYIQDVRIFNRALALGEMEILYDLRNPITNIKMKNGINTIYVRGELNELI